MKPDLVSDRIYLRQLNLSDVNEEYVDWLNSSEVNRYLEVRYEEHSIETCTDFVEKCNGDPSTHLFGIFDSSNDNHIGNVKVGPINDRYKRGQISLLIGNRSYWGKGYATETISLITKYCFSVLALHRIEAGCYEENIGSLRAFLKCGYRVEGFFNDHVLLDGGYQSCFWLAKTN